MTQRQLHYQGPQKLETWSSLHSLPVPQQIDEFPSFHVPQ